MSKSRVCKNLHDLHEYREDLRAKHYVLDMRRLDSLFVDRLMSELLAICGADAVQDSINCVYRRPADERAANDMLAGTDRVNEERDAWDHLQRR